MAVKTTLKENISIALTSIKGNRLRTSLTSLIIAIGIMALVGILTSIQGIRNQTNAAFAGLGANSFTIQNSNQSLNFGNGGHSKVYPPVTYEQADRFRTTFNLPVQIAVNLEVSGTSVVKYGNKKTNPNTNVVGSNENYLVANGYKIGFGRNFSAEDLSHDADVVIIGDDVRQRLFGNQDAIDKSILVGDNRFRVIGVFAKKGSGMGGLGGDRICVIPVSRAKQIDTVPNPTFSIKVMAKSPAVLDATVGEATALFRNIRDLAISKPDNFGIDRSDSIQKQLEGNLDNVTYGGLAIGIITLIGAAIGLMNIMLVSVTERTREIGLRKAIGATPSIIRKQFLIEAIVICLIGGASGIVLGIAIGNLIVIITGGGFVVPWEWMFSALVICTLIGLLSGFYPAKKASKLDPVEALRYE
jgi:putative ABC transport system permease protein